MKQANDIESLNLFTLLKKDLAKLDPVAFAENFLTIDGKPFDMSSHGSGYKYLADAMRYVASQAENINTKPSVILKGRQVGATIMAATLSLYFTASGLYGTGIGGKPPIRILHLFPTIPIMSKYTKDKLEPMMRHSQDNYIAKRSLKSDPNSGIVADDTLTEKTFAGDNKIRVDSIGKDGDRIRGLTQDAILFDECQDMPESAIENALRILTAAQYGKKTQGIQMYFGTPKDVGSKFWKFWDESDQRFYQLKCSGCSHHFFLYEYGKDTWKEIWVEGFTVKCPKCSCLQDKRVAVDNGRWEPTRDPERARYAGFHINIILDPRFTKELVLDFDPSLNPSRNDKAWKNETLGEFYSAGGDTLTMEEVINNALDPKRELSMGISDSSTDKVYTLGIDWGGKSLGTDADNGRGQSYTVMTVLSCDQHGVFTVENSFRLRKNTLTHRIRAVEELYDRYMIRSGAADYFFGNDIVDYFQTEQNWGSKLLACHNSGTLNKLLSYDPKQIRVILNKDRMIDEVFGLIRNGKLKFPVAGTSWDSILWLMQHCTSMETQMVMKSDNYVKRYIKGAMPNDGLMSIIYALIAYRFVATSGFQSRTKQVPKQAYPTPLLAYAPSMRL